MYARQLAIISLALALSTSPAWANLVVNGGFETGSFAPWTPTSAAAGSSFSVSNFAANTGAFSTIFQADAGQHDAISQTLPTSIGQQYAIDYWVQNLGVGDDSLQIYWEGNLVLDWNPVASELEIWVKHSLPVTATMAGSELRFAVYDNISTVFIDDISVIEVPEPAALALLATGALLLRRRRVRIA